MKKLLFAVLVLASFIGGCSETKKCKVKMYGPEYMTYSGDHMVFNEASRLAMYELSYKIINDDKSVHYPHSGEVSSSHAVDGDTVVLKYYFKTKDKDGFEYSITNIKLTGKEPFVVLETTNPDKYILVNALMEKFHKLRIEISN